jgi:cation:H+ antiporter
VALWLAFAAMVPGITLRMSGWHAPEPAAAALYGLAIVGAAFLLAWAAEVAQLDVSAGLAIAVLAFIAVLPEYAVDLVFAWKGGEAFEAFGHACRAPGATGESPCSLALANMTGANRLLIGIGWSLVVLIAWTRARRSGRPMREIHLERANRVEVSFLALATTYSLLLPLKHSITPVDALVLVGIFAAYAIRIARAPAAEPHLIGPARAIGALPVGRRRASVVALFALSAAAIVLCAEPFAEALVGTGDRLGVSEFLLVQWVAPLASEAPELLIAGLYAWRLRARTGLSTLVSSKVNQWTLLVGTLPVVFALASGGLHGLPIDAHQRGELFLTAAQSLLGVAVLVTLSLSTGEALLLFGLFSAQFAIGAVVPASLRGAELVALGLVYLAVAATRLAHDRRHLGPLLRDGFRTPIEELAAPPSRSTG